MNSPTTGITKNPTTPRTAPAAMVRPGTPESRRRRPGTRYFTTDPTSTIATTIPSTVHATTSARPTAHTPTPATTSTSPGRIGSAIPTMPTTTSTAASAVV